MILGLMLYDLRGYDAESIFKASVKVLTYLGLDDDDGASLLSFESALF